eukprot:403372727
MSSKNSASSDSSLDKIPVKQSRKSSKRSAKPDSKRSQQQDAKNIKKLDVDTNVKLRKKSTLKQIDNSNKDQDNTLSNLINQSSFLLGSIKEQIEQQSKKAEQTKQDIKHSEQLSKIKHINDELDDVMKVSGDLAKQFKFKDGQQQVNQNNKTGELKSSFNFSSQRSYKNDSKSIQASILNEKFQPKLKSGVSSVVGRVPSENPLSNEIRIIMKHEGVQTDKKQQPVSQDERQETSNQQSNLHNVKRSQSYSQVPKLQLPNSQQDNERRRESMNQSQALQNQQQFINQPIQVNYGNHQPQSRFVNRTPSRLNQYEEQLRIQNRSVFNSSTYSQKPAITKPHLLMQDFYRQNTTNITHIQNNLQQTLTSNPSYQNIYNHQQPYQRLNQTYQQQLQQSQNSNRQYMNTQQSLNQRDINQQQLYGHQSNIQTNPYNHSRQQNNNQQHTNGYLQQFNSQSTGRFSVQSEPIHNINQQINNIDHAMAILLN